MLDFSVITATYNAARTVAACLESVQKNKLAHTEHVVVDGASTDQTLEVIRRYPGVICISEKDNGIYDAMNKGIQQASGEWINFMNCGDTFYTSTIVNEIFNDEKYFLIQDFFVKAVKELFDYEFIFENNFESFYTIFPNSFFAQSGNRRYRYFLLHAPL